MIFNLRHCFFVYTIIIVIICLLKLYLQITNGCAIIYEYKKDVKKRGKLYANDFRENEE